MRSLAADIKKIYGTSVSCIPVMAFIDYCHRPCRSVVPKLLIMGFFPFFKNIFLVENKETEKRKGVLFPLILIFCVATISKISSCYVGERYIITSSPAVCTPGNIRAFHSKRGSITLRPAPLHSGLQSISGSTLEL